MMLLSPNMRELVDAMNRRMPAARTRATVETFVCREASLLPFSQRAQLIDALTMDLGRDHGPTRMGLQDAAGLIPADHPNMWAVRDLVRAATRRARMLELQCKHCGRLVDPHGIACGCWDSETLAHGIA